MTRLNRLRPVQDLWGFAPVPLGSTSARHWSLCLWITDPSAGGGSWDLFFPEIVQEKSTMQHIWSVAKSILSGFYFIWQKKHGCSIAFHCLLLCFGLGGWNTRNVVRRQKWNWLPVRVQARLTFGIKLVIFFAFGFQLWNKSSQIWKNRLSYVYNIYSYYQRYIRIILNCNALKNNKNTNIKFNKFSLGEFCFAFAKACSSWRPTKLRWRCWRMSWRSPWIRAPRNANSECNKNVAMFNLSGRILFFIQKSWIVKEGVVDPLQDLLLSSGLKPKDAAWSHPVQGERRANNNAQAALPSWGMVPARISQIWISNTWSEIYLDIYIYIYCCLLRTVFGSIGDRPLCPYDTFFIKHWYLNCLAMFGQIVRKFSDLLQNCFFILDF